jgi:hypothetical protein
MIGAGHIGASASAWVDGIAVGLATIPRNRRSCVPRFNGEKCPRSPDCLVWPSVEMAGLRLDQLAMTREAIFWIPVRYRRVVDYAGGRLSASEDLALASQSVHDK